MKIILFAHSFVSDWNHGNAHFLRGLGRALGRQGHEVVCCERWTGWSAEELFRDHGHGPFLAFARSYPDLDVRFYGDWPTIEEEVDELTRGADLVLVHEFNDPRLVSAIGQLRRRRDDFVLLFHDTHHRAVSTSEIASLDLGGYDGFLAFGDSLADVYRHKLGLGPVWTFHEAADTTVFFPREAEPSDDLIWIGNWGDEERSAEIRDYFIESARLLPELRFVAHGVRYPAAAMAEIANAGIDFRGWIANHQVPEAFARARMTIHLPRGPYLSALPGIPTIRPFEALACGIPLISTPWPDTERLFRPGIDHLRVTSPVEMRAEVLRLSLDEDARQALAENGLATIRAGHTCDHRAEQLVDCFARLSC